MPMFNAAEGLPAELEDQDQGFEAPASEAEARTLLQAKEAELNDLFSLGKLNEHASAASIERGDQLTREVKILKKRLESK